jgi:hypothetical protein
MSVREQILAKIEKMNEEQLAELLRFINLLLAEEERTSAYDPENDPILTGEALFDGETDLAERNEELLYGERVEHKT